MVTSRSLIAVGAVACLSACSSPAGSVPTLAPNASLPASSSTAGTLALRTSASLLTTPNTAETLVLRVSLRESTRTVASPNYLSPSTKAMAGPNTITLQPPSPPGYPFGNYTVQLTARAKPPADSGAGAIGAAVTVGYSGDICGILDEFPTPRRCHLVCRYILEDRPSSLGSEQAISVR